MTTEQIAAAEAFAVTLRGQGYLLSQQGHDVIMGLVRALRAAPTPAPTREQLASIEWAGNRDWTDRETCPACGRYEAKGHTAECWLAAALAREGFRWVRESKTNAAGNTDTGWYLWPVVRESKTNAAGNTDTGWYLWPVPAVDVPPLPTAAPAPVAQEPLYPPKFSQDFSDPAVIKWGDLPVGVETPGAPPALTAPPSASTGARPTEMPLDVRVDDVVYLADFGLRHVSTRQAAEVLTGNDGVEGIYRPVWLRKGTR